MNERLKEHLKIFLRDDTIQRIEEIMDSNFIVTEIKPIQGFVCRNNFRHPLSFGTQHSESAPTCEICNIKAIQVREIVE